MQPPMNAHNLDVFQSAFIGGLRFSAAAPAAPNPDYFTQRGE
jgi:hypothetical protein